MVLTISSVRLAEAADVPLLQYIEAAGDAQFVPYLDTAAFGEPTSGRERVAEGVVLVIGTPALGFAHLIELDDGTAHLEQLAVHPRAQRRGLGRTLLRAVYGLVRDRDLDRLTLTIYADVPWSAPFYAAHGFRVVPEPRGALGRVVAHERQRGLERELPRVAMQRIVRDEPTPIPAVSVLPVRDGADGLEVFVQVRAATMDFVPGALVFPGGRIDAGDRVTGAALDLPGDLVDDHARAWRHTAYGVLGDARQAARTVLACAVREVAEETGAVIDPARLLPWDDWETPLGSPKRFDVRFLLLPVRSDAEAAEFTHATTEAHRSEWMPVRDVEAGAEDGSLYLVAPTRVLVEELATLGSVDAAAALRPPITRVRDDICPTPPLRGRLASNDPTGD